MEGGAWRAGRSEALTIAFLALIFPRMSHEDGSPCLAHLGDSVSGFTTICPGVEGIITASFLLINGLQPSSLYPPGSLTVKRIFFAPSQVFGCYRHFHLGLEQRVVPGAHWHRDRLSKKAPAREAQEEGQRQPGSAGAPGRGPALTLTLTSCALSCQLLPRPARGWEVERALPSHQSDSWPEGGEEVGGGHQVVGTREVTVRRDRAGCSSLTG